ncbi:hypothetical protein G7067_12090 [Leucobacter insecticola]|uniref:DUF6457 domain-containing protein n=1 Tax=Leucobacter insecticola TaxID=2714934 RepID=A0A6G8FLU6_9MICO|nr:hypothetical protein G7067_12090 [Leucobacter insecticola]
MNDWLAAVSVELGLDPATVDIAALLNVARDVAHDVARPAAPLSTFLLGVAVGRAEDPAAALDEYAQTLTELAASWESSPL